MMIGLLVQLQSLIDRKSSTWLEKFIFITETMHHWFSLLSIHIWREWIKSSLLFYNDDIFLKLSCDEAFHGDRRWRCLFTFSATIVGNVCWTESRQHQQRHLLTSYFLKTWNIKNSSKSHLIILTPWFSPPQMKIILKIILTPAQ
jgi:hypothetical protein